LATSSDAAEVKGQRAIHTNMLPGATTIHSEDISDAVIIHLCRQAAAATIKSCWANDPVIE